MSSDKFHCTNGHCLTDCVLSSIDYDRSFPPSFCPHSGGAVYWQKCETTEKKQTLFDRITASPEVLAPYCVSTRPSINGDTLYYYSTVTRRIYLTESEAIAATIKKLKEVEK